MRPAFSYHCNWEQWAAIRRHLLDFGGEVQDDGYAVEADGYLFVWQDGILSMDVAPDTPLPLLVWNADDELICRFWDWEFHCERVIRLPAAHD